MLLSEIIGRASLQCFGEMPLEEIEISGICPDSSRVKPGDIFIAVKGLRADGHLFVREAANRGASALVVSREAILNGTVDPRRFNGLPLIVVDDTRVAMAKLYAAFYNNPQLNLKIIGVTGTNGKTTVCRLIYEMLISAGKRCALIGTMGCLSSGKRINISSHNPCASMTTPDPEELYRILALARDDGAEYAVMEVTSHALSLGKVAPICFETAVFTNLSEDHLDFHGDMESYYQSKKRLFSMCRSAVINFDDRYGRRLSEEIEISPRLCSAEGRGTETYAEDISLLGERGIEYKLTSRSLRLRVRSPMSGGFNVMNTMQAALVAHSLGVSVAHIKDTLATFSGIKGRLERLKLPQGCEFSVFIDFAHTPDALENLLRTARGFARDGQRIVLLFGCGGDRDRGKRPIMGKFAVALADYVIITGDNSRSENVSDIISQIASGIDSNLSAGFTVIENRREAIEYAVRSARRGDIILLAGKGHEEYEIDSEGKRPFSERELVDEFVRKYW